MQNQTLPGTKHRESSFLYDAPKAPYVRFRYVAILLVSWFSTVIPIPVAHGDTGALNYDALMQFILYVHDIDDG